jgi:hypothetical protein
MTDIANPVAQAQAAKHRAALLLERSRNGQAEDSPQARWHAAQQAALLAWLEAGGFAQHAPERETAKENSGTQPLLSVPQRDLNEESKFSLSRIDDAVE